jgi:hypothetical protein
MTPKKISRLLIMRDFPDKNALDAVWIVHDEDGWIVIGPRKHSWIFATLAAAREEAVELARGFDLPVFCEVAPP